MTVGEPIAAAFDIGCQECCSRLDHLLHVRRGTQRLSRDIPNTAAATLERLRTDNLFEEFRPAGKIGVGALLIGPAIGLSERADQDGIEDFGAMRIYVLHMIAQRHVALGAPDRRAFQRGASGALGQVGERQL